MTFWYAFIYEAQSSTISLFLESLSWSVALLWPLPNFPWTPATGFTFPLIGCNMFDTQENKISKFCFLINNSHIHGNIVVEPICCIWVSKSATKILEVFKIEFLYYRERWEIFQVKLSCFNTKIKLFDLTEWFTLCWLLGTHANQRVDKCY